MGIFSSKNHSDGFQRRRPLFNANQQPQSDLPDIAKRQEVTPTSHTVQTEMEEETAGVQKMEEEKGAEGMQMKEEEAAPDTQMMSEEEPAGSVQKMEEEGAPEAQMQTEEEPASVQTKTAGKKKA